MPGRLCNIKEINQLPGIDAACRRGVGYVAENTSIPPYLSLGGFS